MPAPRGQNPAIVYEALSESNRPLTAYQILELVKDRGLKGPPTIYRALEMLKADGLVHRVESINAFVASNHDRRGQPDPSFMICKSCGVAAEFHDKRLGRLLSEWKNRARFSVSRQTVELVGTCQACQG